MKVKALNTIIVNSVDKVRIFTEKENFKYEDLYEGNLNEAPKALLNMQVDYIGADDKYLFSIKVR